MECNGSGQNEQATNEERLPRPIVKLGYRLAQMTSAPGVYTFALIVNDNGTYELVIGGGPGVERLGRVR